MDKNEVLTKLEALGSERYRKVLNSHGANENTFGVAIKDMNPIAKKIKRELSPSDAHALAEKLYATGNYDAMYFAGMIADSKTMTAEDFERWMDAAYFYMISDYTVAIVLAERELEFALPLADLWINSSEELRMSCGYCVYAWLLGTRKDAEFDCEKLKTLLKKAEEEIHFAPNRARYSMNNFIMAVGISYLPLHDEAVKVAQKVGAVTVNQGKTACSVPVAKEYIENAARKGRLGFKRKALRC